MSRMICLAWLSWSFPHLRASKLTRKCCSISPVTCCIPTLDICSHISTRTRSLGSILSVESELGFYEVWPVDWWSNKDGKVWWEYTLHMLPYLSAWPTDQSTSADRHTAFCQLRENQCVLHPGEKKQTKVTRGQSSEKQNIQQVPPQH